MHTNKPDFNEYAVIDLGSNSFHMIIAKKIDNSLQIIYKNKQQVQLASGLDKYYHLSQESIQRAINSLALFAERLKDFPISHVKVVGTFTLRVAKNRLEFLKAASLVFPFPIEIVSGQEEARLIYLGAINSESVKQSDVKFIIDVGGGSTEIAIGKDQIPAFVESRPMGCVTYAKRFFPNQVITKQYFERAKLAAEQQVEKFTQSVKSKNITIAFGSSGTIKSIYKILLDLGVTDGIITLKRLEDLVSYVLEFKCFDDIDFPSLSNDRKLIFVSGLAIFYGVFSAFGLQELHYTHSALREGVLYEITGHKSTQDICEKTVGFLIKHYNIDKLHAGKTVDIVKWLFSQWKISANIIIDEKLESLLYWSAWLHEIGLSINFSNIHKHSAYILKNCNMPGFNEEQQFLLSTLVRYHRKGFMVENIPNFSLFEQKQVLVLLQILRLAVLINNQRSATLNEKVFKLRVLDDNIFHVELYIENDFAKTNGLILLDLEQEQIYWQENKHWQLDIRINEAGQIW